MNPKNRLTSNIFPVVLFMWIAVCACSRPIVPPRADDPCAQPVPSSSGLVRGTSESDGSTCVWRGIPYAAPPVGEFRWQAPRKAEPWPGVREAAKWGAQCMQKDTKPTLGTPDNMSEDCLFLNVWSPGRAGKLPVMVWIHGGGLYLGTGSIPLYYGNRLAQAGGMVVVSINYRLNIFGFMAHPALREEDPRKSTGNYGTMDQAFALQWVRDNIENFGGDPGNVTIFGESGGAWSVCTLVATPLAKGLFHRAIIQSGGCEASRGLKDAYELSRREFKKFGCDYNDLQCARGLPAEKLLKKGTETIISGFEFLPVNDGYVLKATPLEMIKAGDFNRVPVMAGTNLDEFAGVLKLIPKYYFTRPEKYREGLKGIGATGPEAERLAELYPLSEFKNRPVEAYGRMYGADAVLLAPTVRALQALAGQGGAAFLYHFEYRGLKYENYMGVFHGADLPFVFDSLDRGIMKPLFDRKNISAARELTRIIQGYWLNFARKGDPNGEGLPAWTAFSARDPRVQILDTTVKNVPLGDSERCRFWDGYSQEYLTLLNGLLSELNRKYHLLFELMAW